jgi:hypothetical protein
MLQLDVIPQGIDLSDWTCHTVQRTNGCSAIRFIKDNDKFDIFTGTSCRSSESDYNDRLGKIALEFIHNYKDNTSKKGFSWGGNKSFFCFIDINWTCHDGRESYERKQDQKDWDLFNRYLVKTNVLAKALWHILYKMPDSNDPGNSDTIRVSRLPDFKDSFKLLRYKAERKLSELESEKAEPVLDKVLSPVLRKIVQGYLLQ